VRAIRGANFAQDRSALLHDFWDSKAVADFDELSPRYDHFSAASQSASVTNTAAAQLFTTMAASAPSNLVNNSAVCTSRFAARACFESYSRLLYAWRCAEFVHHVSGKGARPRLVCIITPVALMTGCNERERIFFHLDGNEFLTEASSRLIAVQFESSAIRRANPQAPPAQLQPRACGPPVSKSPPGALGEQFIHDGTAAAIPPVPPKPFSFRAFPFEHFSILRTAGQCRRPPDRKPGSAQ